MNHTPKQTRYPRILMLFFAVFGCTAAVFAQDFRAEIAGEQRTAKLLPRTIDGVEYLPMDAFCQAFGGNCDAIASQMRATFGEHSAILIYRESEVHSSLGSFILTSPILRFEGATYVASRDIPTLFKRGFEIELTRGTEIAPIAPPETEEPAVEPEADPEIALLMAETGGTEEGVEEAPAPEPEPESEPEPETEPAPAPVAEGAGLDASVIIIDAGHGGRDVGYTANNGLSEKELTLQLSERLINLLKEHTKARIYPTRREDRDLSNSDRVRIANDNSGTLFISLHAGVSRSPQAHGIDLYITDTPVVGQSRALGASPRRDAANSVEASRALAHALAGQLSAKAGVNVRGVRQAPLRVLDAVAMPGVLVEVGYLSNPAEAERLKQGAHLDKIAEAILAGILQASGQGGAQQ